MSQLPHLRELIALPAQTECARRCGTSTSMHRSDVIDEINKRITAFKPVNSHAILMLIFWSCDVGQKSTRSSRMRVRVMASNITLQ